MIRKVATFILLSCSALNTLAHNETASSEANKVFNHLDLSVSAGSTGIGLELSMPVHDFMRVRAGGTFMPHFHYGMHFSAQTEHTIDKKNFSYMAEMLEGFIGQRIDNLVDMRATPNLNQFKLLIDVMPFNNKDWHFTAGFFAGKPRIAQAITTEGEAATLFSINFYNHFVHDNKGHITNGVFLDPEIYNALKQFGRAGFPMGEFTHDIFYETDVFDINPDTGEPLQYSQDVWDIDENGEFYITHHQGEQIILHHKGDVMHKEGDTYLMEPNKDNRAFADAFVNKFRPYFGVGYTKTIDKGNRWKIGFDAGVMFWGGMPKLIDHNGVNLINDVKDVKGQVGDYINIAKHAKAFPLLEIKLTRHLF